MRLVKTVVLNTSFRMTFSPWRRNDTVSFLFFLYGLVYPRQGLLRYPLMGLCSLGSGLVTQISWPPYRSPYGIGVAYFLLLPSQPFFSNTFKIHLLNMPNHPHFNQPFSSRLKALINTTYVKSNHFPNHDMIMHMNW